MLITKATKYATIAHEGQMRKNTKVPYVTHPIAVSEIIQHSGHCDDAIVAGLLHDVVEDTDITLEEIEKEFGAKIAAIVDGVSEDKSITPWKARKKSYIEKLISAPKESMIVSAADKIHNLTDTHEQWTLIGDEVFTRFNAQKKSQSWWYRSMSEVFAKHGHKDVSDSINLMLDEMGM